MFDFNSEAFKEFYESKNPEGDIILKYVTENLVFKELLHLNASKSTGLDGIPAKFLKDGAEVLKLLITWIINLSISENAVPTSK